MSDARIMVRQFYIYKDRQLVLVVADAPGILQSVAAPPPGLNPPPPLTVDPTTVRSSPNWHPFLNAQSYNATTEHTLRKLLDQSIGFDNYLQTLLKNGFDIAADKHYTIEEGRLIYHVYHVEQLIGALWQIGGRFATLRRPVYDTDDVYPQAMLTVYELQYEYPLLQALKTSESFEALILQLQALQFRLVPR